MQVIFPDIDRSKIRVNPDDIIRLLGVREDAVDAHSAALVNQYIEECSKIMTPSAGYVLAESVDPESPEEIAIEGVRFHSGRIIHNMLKLSESYAFFVVTAGPETEALARVLLGNGAFLEGYIADLVASAIVESMADLVHEEIRKLAGTRDMKVTNRYSPGYCSWDVAEQQKLFRLFPDDCCGISLSESSLMSPVKSASGIIGMGSNVKFNEYACEICSMKNCLFRRRKN
ncbi:MAG: hypothetical protein KAR16_00045 [Bacteroidales bacterium]|nr:hypothetical protein [Bacteroidales bacterium]